MKRKAIILIMLVGLFTACSEDFLDTKPTASIEKSEVFKSVKGTQAVVDGVLRYWRESTSNHDEFGWKAIDLVSDLMAEDIVVRDLHWFNYDYLNDNRNATYRRTNYLWTLGYRSIRNLNEVIAYVDAAEGSQEEKDHIKAQALAMRAYSYFRLIQHYQQTYFGNESEPGIPLYTEPTNEGADRGTVQDVYDLINNDLDEAIALFTSAGLDRRDMSQLDISVARGIRARVALVMNDWANAAAFAAAARDDYDLNSMSQYEQGFDNYALQNWMWGLPVNDEQSTIYASFFSHLDMTIGGYAGLGYSRKYLSKPLFDAMQTDDVRKSLCIPVTLTPTTIVAYVNLKLNAGRSGGKGFSADYVMMRPEEMLLIEAEARIRLAIAGDAAQEATAQGLLQELWNERFETPPTVTETGAALLDRILWERRIELWGEGFGLYDVLRLKRGIDRTGYHNNVMPGGQTIAAESWRFLYQIPQNEIDNNTLLDITDQNP